MKPEIIRKKKQNEGADLEQYKEYKKVLGDDLGVVNVNIRMIKKWKIIMYKKWIKILQNPLWNYYLSIES